MKAGGRGLAAGEDGRHRVRLRRASGLFFDFLIILCAASAGAGLVLPPRGPWRGSERRWSGRIDAAIGTRAGGPSADFQPARLLAAGRREGRRPLPAREHSRERACTQGPVGRLGGVLAPAALVALAAGCPLAPVAPRLWGACPDPTALCFFCFLPLFWVSTIWPAFAWRREGSRPDVDCGAVPGGLWRLEPTGEQTAGGDAA
ncbi:hypothetical protein NDU88_002292 [Pleurodeles waltl]|uniref:Uncharacterized protein n=1 Tax=Pleurodeles waltl TaxID=8319 RepID=A0AAV7RDD1_PLEWA|nr:hypothetical protein NDU88_002292 [Pleurodeles waltl]